jgi:dihydroneopterin aldolase/2-amino-4-hydroxy-6-hydroxymethyldihydropteridine diphosphokinase
LEVNNPMDRIHLRDLRVSCIIGTGEEERERRQEILIDVTLHLDLAAAGRSDHIDDTVDYSNLARGIVEVAEASSFRLIERLAEAIAGFCLANPRVERVEVRVDKPHALPLGRAAAVEIVRDRDNSRRPMGFGQVT